MKTERKTAVIVGVLLIAALAVSLLGNALTGSILAAPDYLASVAANGNRIMIGALLTFLAAAGSAGIAIALYPVLKKQNEGLALGSVGFRLIEGVFYIVDALCLAALVVVSQHALGAGSQNVSTFQTIGDLLLAIGDLAGFVFAVFAFCLGGLMYYFIFYQAKLVPRWLSIWGMIALVLLLAAVFLTLFDGEPYSVSGNLIYLALPIAAQELVMGGWLIVKGFNPADVPAESANVGDKGFKPSVMAARSAKA